MPQWKVMPSFCLMSRNVPEGESYSEYWDRARDSIAQMAKEAEKEGGIIAIEPLVMWKQTFSLLLRRLSK